MALKRSGSTHEIVAVPLILLCVSLLVMYWHDRDINQQYGWPIFFVWAITFIMSVVFVYKNTHSPFIHKMKLLLKQDIYILIALTLFAGAIRFIFMGQYPYIALGDEIRDSGLNAYKILEGQTTDMFGLGDYNGYGNFIPLLAYPFIFLFGHTVFMYRVPAAIVGVISIILTYLFARVYWGRLVGVVAALLLSVSIFHIHYSRIELLVILDSFLGILVILSYMPSFKSKYGMFLFGLMCGFAMHFYAGVRGIIVILIGFSCCYYGVKVVRKLLNLSEVLLIIFMFVSGFLIAIGPTLQVTIQAAGQSTGVAPVIYKQHDFIKLSPLEKGEYLAKLYADSFLIYTFKVTNDEHISYHTTLLPEPINWIFIIGLLVLAYTYVKKKNIQSALLLFLVFAFPITNEMSVNHAGADHRLMSIIAVLYIVSAIGAVSLLRAVVPRYTKILLLLFLIIFATFQLKFYFIERPSDFLYQFRNGKDYTFQHILESAWKDEASDIYILNDPVDYIFMQYTEKLRFYLMGKFYAVLNPPEFNKALRDNLRARNKKAAFYIFDKTQLIDGLTYREYNVSCQKHGFLPAYECPIGKEDSYSYYRVENYR